MELRSRDIVADFMYNLPEKFPHKQCAELLFAGIQQRKDLVLDFNDLQASVGPAILQLNQEFEGEDQKINYEEILVAYFNTTGALADLLTFKLRGFERACEDFPLANGFEQFHSLTELDLAGNCLSNEIQETFQLWPLTDLQTLKLDKTGLSHLPPSIGRLRKLEHLSLSENSLSALPVTLSFCQAIKFLNISKNKFNAVPGVILQLQNLEDLRRLDNPLMRRWQGFERFPHLTRVPLKPIEKIEPDRLQALCTKIIMTCHVDYWFTTGFPPLQCKTLDNFASQYTYCENCHDALEKDSEGWVITVMVPKFVGLRNVPFRMHSCANCCSVIEKKLTEKQKQLLQEIDKEYDEYVRQAIEAEALEEITFENKELKCSIM